jgi:hypothetical protein
MIFSILVSRQDYFAIGFVMFQIGLLYTFCQLFGPDEKERE